MENKDIEQEDKKEEKKRGKIEVLSNMQINIIATIVFVLFYFFLGVNKYSIKEKLIQDRAILYHQMDSIQDQITSDSILIRQLENSDDALEKYVRENFYMHREGEEIFIIDSL